MSIQLQPGPSIMMTLGSFQFGILTAAYNELQHVREWKWASQERFTQRPILQFVGMGEESISLPGIIYPEFRGGQSQIQDLRDLADEAQPQTLIDGTGNVLGKYVIEKVEEKQTIFASGGMPQKQEFTVSLKFFSDLTPDEAAAVEQNADALAAIQFNNVNNAPTTSGIIDNTINNTAAISGNISGSITQVSSIGGLVPGGVLSILDPLNSALSIANGFRFSALDSKSILGKSVSSIAQISSLTQLVNSATSANANAGLAGSNLSAAIRSLGGGLSPAVSSVLTNAQVSVNRLIICAAKTRGDASTMLGSF